MPTDHTDHWLETYKSLIHISVEAFKYCALINGGAIVALLAYLGDMAGKGQCVVPDMRCPMGAFFMGLIFCGASFFTSYFTQLSLLDEIRRGKNETSTGEKSGKHETFLWITAIFYVLSGLSFFIGGWLSILSLTST